MFENLWLFKATFSFGSSQKPHGAKSGGWANFVSDFNQKCLYSWSVMIQDPCIMANFRSFLRTSVVKHFLIRITILYKNRLIHAYVMNIKFDVIVTMHRC